MSDKKPECRWRSRLNVRSIDAGVVTAMHGTLINPAIRLDSASLPDANDVKAALAAACLEYREERNGDH